MRTRPFRSWAADLPAMQAVCSAMLLDSPGRAVVHPGDIAWFAGWPPKPVERLAEMLLLWEEGDSVVGFATFLPEEADLSVFVLPSYMDSDEAIGFEDVAEAWASRGGAAVSWTELEDELTAVERWRARGYRPVDGGYLNLVRPLEDVMPSAAPDPRVRPVAEDDVDDRARITHAAFDESMPLERYLADYRGFRDSPAYPRGWDLMLRDEDGRPAACCIAWTDPVSRAATFEPVATHPPMHRRGFGRALLEEGCRRLAAEGMTYVIVGVDLANVAAETLYRSVGFVPDRVLRSYVKS